VNDYPKKVLRDLVARYGISLARDPNRCEGLLRDTCGKYNREIFVLVNAVRQRVPADLLAPRHALPVSLMKDFLIKRLEDELGFSANAAQWAVDSWAEALELKDAPPAGISAGITASGRRTVPVFPGSASDNPPSPEQRGQWADELEADSLSARLGAVAKLLHTPDAECTRLLIGALDNARWQVRNAAYDALIELGDAAIPRLIEALKDTDEKIVWRAALILGSLRARDAAGPLAGLLGWRGTVRECAIWALGEIGSTDASTALLRLLDHPDPTVSRDAELALAKIGKGKKCRNGELFKDN
jgi:hypothetical protein